MSLVPIKDEKSFDEVEIVISIANTLIKEYKLSTKNCLYVVDLLKDQFEELLEAERNGDYFEFRRKIAEGRKKNG